VSDIFDNPDVMKYLQHAEQEMLPKMRGAALSLAILATPDAKLCLEIGAAILFDRPLILLVPDRNMRIPANLKRCAVAIIHGSASDPDARKQLQQAMANVIANDERARKTH
jgi:hypothetical protein